MKNIILVDDHSLFREGIKLLIENEGIGHIMAEASNGQEFLDLLPYHSPDLVIMDIEMPVLNGLEATKKAMKLYPGIKIMVLTMLNEKSNYVDFVNEGALGLVLKTAGKQEFEKAIQSITEGGSYFSNELLRQIILQQKLSTSTESVELPVKLSTEISNREMDVLKLLCKGLTVSEVADELFLSVKTIETHRSNLLKKTNTRNTINLILFAIKNKMAEI